MSKSPVPEGAAGPWTEYQGTLFVVPYKNGSRSIIELFGNESLVQSEDFPTAHPRVTFVVRNPDARLLSAWRFVFPDNTIEEVIDKVIGEDEDPHLVPQVQFLRGLLPTRVLQITQLMEEYAGLPHLNRTNSSEYILPSYRRAELRAAYAADWDYFNSTL